MIFFFLFFLLCEPQYDVIELAADQVNPARESSRIRRCIILSAHVKEMTMVYYEVWKSKKRNVIAHKMLITQPQANRLQSILVLLKAQSSDQFFLQPTHQF